MVTDIDWFGSVPSGLPSSARGTNTTIGKFETAAFARITNTSGPATASSCTCWQEIPSTQPAALGICSRSMPRPGKSSCASLRFHPCSIKSRIICWTGEGLVIVIACRAEWAIKRDSESTVWFPVMTNRRSASILLLADPVNFAAKKAWPMPRLHQVAGSVNSDLVYAVYGTSSVAVINIKTGQLLNLHYQQAGFRSPVVSADGRWLVAGGPDGSLKGYRISGTELVRSSNGITPGVR